ncbi:hypothetical protein PCANC_02489 [Puccinia coronata f. sp. avenae]|uniref:Uncharacterized protein n=1 Tax=Puccinia coronata f. sp. avenae TaxID=200324 RepID=A0A2N5VYG4_9BASI|nr:hypothetical protein PCASD_10539 [Puccinia coronata f. sp. avenae]PLW55028.1 hypothetical protein PCANC_02489 [Puccinia coronata f. sp. avenae]
MNRTPLVSLIVVVALLTLLQHTEAAVVGHHPDSIRKSIQRKTGSVQRPSFLLFSRATEVEDDIDNNEGSANLTRELQHRPESTDDEDSGSLSFMMIRTSTFNTNDQDSPGSSPFGGEQTDSPSVVSIGMTIIEFSDSPDIETRKVARRFGSRAPLSIERKYPSYAAALKSGLNEEEDSSQPKPVTQNTLPEHATASRAESAALQDFWRRLGERNTQIPLSIPVTGTPTEEAERPQDSYQKTSSSAPKTQLPHPFTDAVKKQVVLSPVSTFDNTSHHSQL